VDPKDENRAFCCGTRPPLRREHRARGVPHGRRRQDLEEGALQGREHRGGGLWPSTRATRKRSTPYCGASRQGAVGRTVRGRGRAAGCFKSTDGGDTWKHLTKGLAPTPEGLGRIGLDVSRSDPKCLFRHRRRCPSGGRAVPLRRCRGETGSEVNADSRLWGSWQRLRRGQDRPEEQGHPLRPPTSVCISPPTAAKSSTCFKGGPRW